MIINGAGFGDATSATLVNADGSPITGLAPITVFASETATAITIPGDVGMQVLAWLIQPLPWAGVYGLILLITPGVMSPASLGFTVSDAISKYTGDPDVNFNAGGYAAGSNTYDQSNGNLILKDGLGLASMKGVSVIELWVGGAQVATDLTPSDWTVNAAGTEITITQAKLAAAHSAWYTPGGADAVIIFQTPAGTSYSTAAFTTQP